MNIDATTTAPRKYVRALCYFFSCFLLLIFLSVLFYRYHRGAISQTAKNEATEKESKNKRQKEEKLWKENNGKKRRERHGCDERIAALEQNIFADMQKSIGHRQARVEVVAGTAEYSIESSDDCQGIWLVSANHLEIALTSYCTRLDKNTNILLPFSHYLFLRSNKTFNKY